MGGGKSNYIEYKNYIKEMDIFLSAIKNSNSRNIISPEEYITGGGWNARKNGCYLTDNKQIYSEIVKNGDIIITVLEPKTDWKEWIKTIGNLVQDEDNYTLIYKDKQFNFSCIINKQGYTVRIKENITNEYPLFRKYFRQVFRKAAYCTACKTCNAICKNGCISFDRNLSIKNCKHCFDCHSMEVGCLAYHSLTIPDVENNKMKSLNTFSNHAPKVEWLNEFFERKNDYLQNNSLGRVQKPFFKRFLKDSGLIDKNETTNFVELGISLKWDSDCFLGLVFINLVNNNPQIEWYVKELNCGTAYKRKEVEDKLTEKGQSNLSYRTSNNQLEIFNLNGSQLDEVTVYDLQGRIAGKQQNSAQTIFNLSNGVYVVKAISKDSVETIKVVVE
jgi:phosphoadenosine phosphosulfate reductase